MRTLLFLHGFLGAKEDWEGVIAALRPYFRCLAIDLPLHSDAIIAELDRQQISTCVLVGYSMGGRIALSLMQRYPDRFSDLIILSSHLGLSDPKEREERWQRDQEWISLLQSVPLETFLEKWYAQPLFAPLKSNPELFKAVLQRRLQQDPHTLMQMLATYSLGKQPACMPPRGLFLCGKEDLKYRALYRTLPSFLTVKEIAHAGHALHLEAAEACAEEIKKYVERTDRAAHMDGLR